MENLQLSFVSHFLLSMESFLLPCLPFYCQWSLFSYHAYLFIVNGVFSLTMPTFLLSMESFLLPCLPFYCQWSLFSYHAYLFSKLSSYSFSICCSTLACFSDTCGLRQFDYILITFELFQIVLQSKPLSLHPNSVVQYAAILADTWPLYSSYC